MQNNLVTCHLPSTKNNDYNLGELGMPCLLSTSDIGRKLVVVSPDDLSPSWARFVLKLRETVAKDRRLFFVNGIAYVANINWLRDHVHEMKGYKHWEYDLKSYIEFMAVNQHEEGYFYDIVLVNDNCHTTFVDPDCVKRLPDEGLALVRIEIEADVEYLMVEGACTVYQATGDDQWIKGILPHLEKGIDYCTSHPKRWDPEHGLVKRTFSIDTWDFTYGYSGTDRRIHPESPMSIMHGDNSGVYQAMRQLAWLNARFGNIQKSAQWEERAETLQKNLNKYCWNGKFFCHQLHLNHTGAEGADESAMLSLSNAYDMNRKITDDQQASSIIEEYRARRETTSAFAEWFSIDPPYERFMDDKSCRPMKSYINGGIASFTAGELAKAAFHYGYEKYGWDILCRVKALTEKCGSLFFLYHPDTAENLSGGPSGWGAAAVMDAIDNGLAGIEDADVCFRILNFSPRWAITDLDEVRYITGYESSRKLVETRFYRGENVLRYELFCPSRTVNCHILLPDGKQCAKALLDGREIETSLVKKRDSVYIDFTFEKEATDITAAWKTLEKHIIEVIYQ